MYSSFLYTISNKKKHLYVRNMTTSACGKVSRLIGHIKLHVKITLNRFTFKRGNRCEYKNKPLSTKSPILSLFVQKLWQAHVSTVLRSRVWYDTARQHTPGARSPHRAQWVSIKVMSIRSINTPDVTNTLTPRFIHAVELKPNRFLLID